MARKKTALTPPLRKLVARIQKRFAPEKILLFGSRARGENFLDSDWDILVISKEFEGVSFRDRMDQIFSLCIEPIGQDIEAFCYTPSEVNQRKQQIGIVKTALETGISIII